MGSRLPLKKPGFQGFDPKNAKAKHFLMVAFEQLGRFFEGPDEVPIVERTEKSEDLTSCFNSQVFAG